MAIVFHEENGTFTLETVKSTYQLKVDDHGMLLHTYFGECADDSDYSYLVMPADRGFCPNPGDERENRTYSMDYYPQEYPVSGNGDFRVNCLEAEFPDGVRECDLRYKSHSICRGKYALAGLPALFDEGEQEAETLEIVLKDRYEDLEVRLLYGVFASAGVITRAVVVENHTGAPVKLTRVMSACVDMPGDDLDMIHFYGKHAMEREMERKPVGHGVTQIGSTRGTSSHQHNPFVILADKHTTEEHGCCWGYALLYSGGFQFQAETDQIGQTRAVMGFDPVRFAWVLDDGEAFTAPEVCMCYSSEGFGGLSRSLHEAYQKHLIRSWWKDKKRPVLINNWEATYFDFNAEKILAIAQNAAELGLDMLVLDDGWFGRRDDDNSGLGDWGVNEKKLGCTMKELADKVNTLGLKFGLWFEPEMVSEDSDLYRAHPDWALKAPGRSPVRGRNQLVLDLSRADVRQYIEESLYQVLDSANIEYVKWDMNRSIANAYSAALPAERQGEVLHRYVLGLYEILEHMLERYPRLLLEGCSGGGGRFDAGMLYYAPQIWCSDNTDAVERLKIQYGTSFGYPMSAISAHVSVCPNHQNGRVTPLKTRGICAMQGTFGYELDLSALTGEEKETIKAQVQQFNENHHLFQFGDYYRLTSPYTNREFTAWEYAERDGSSAYLAVVFTDLHANAEPRQVKWKGLCRKATYEVRDMDGNTAEYTGTALMCGGMLLPVPRENYDSFCFFAKRR